MVDDRTGKQPVQAVSIAVCKCHKVLAHMQTDYSFDTIKFIEMLHEIHGACDNRKVYLFMDNASYHKAEDSQKEMEKLNIEPVWNVPYHFEFNNSCERYWA